MPTTAAATIVLWIIFLSERGAAIEHLLVNQTHNGVSLSGVFISLRNVTSQFSSSHGIHLKLKYDELIAADFSATNNGGDGIVIDSADPQSASGSFQLDSCSVHSNAESGFKVTAWAIVTIRNCVVHSNRLNAVTAEQRQGGSIRLEQSLVYENEGGALQLYSNGVYLNSCTIRDHHYGHWQYSTGIHFYHIEDHAMDVFITNSQFVNSAENILVSGDFSSRPRVHLHIQNNTFVNGNRTLCVHDQQMGSTSYQPALYINIRKNRFLNNVQTAGALIAIEDKNSYGLFTEKGTISNISL